VQSASNAIETIAKKRERQREGGREGMRE